MKWATMPFFTNFKTYQIQVGLAMDFINIAFRKLKHFHHKIPNIAYIASFASDIGTDLEKR